MIQTYVHEEFEVRQTGRTADKMVGTRQLILVEITPVDENNGTWKKWVMPSALFKINQ